MKTNWQTKKLGEVCDFVRGPFGGSLKKSIFKKDGYAVYEQQHAIYNQFSDLRYFIDEKKFNEMKRFELKSGDLIMSCSGTMGKIAIAPDRLKKGIINQALLKLKPSNKILGIFLKLWMQSESFQESLKTFSQGAAIKNVASVKILKQIEIPLPSLTEQHRIVKKLDKVFGEIEKAKKNTEKNLQNSKELFESYLQNIFNNSGTDWQEKRLGDAYDVRDGTHDSPKYQNKGFALITSRNLKKDELDYKKIRYISEKDYHKINDRSKVHKGDILFAMIGTIGNPVVVKIEPDFAIKNVALFKIPKEQDSYFLKYFLDSKFVIDKMMSEAKGTTQKFVGLGYLRDFKIKLPKLSDQKLIVKKLDELSEKTKRLEEIYKQKLADLDELKKSILAKAFNGEL